MADAFDDPAYGCRHQSCRRSLFPAALGFDVATSYYASMPGGQSMVLFGNEAGADLRALSLIHATRVMVIAVTLPFLLHWIWDADLSNPPAAPVFSTSLTQLALMVFSGIAGSQIARRVGMFGASILGPLIIAAAFALTGSLPNSSPPRLFGLRNSLSG